MTAGKYSALYPTSQWERHGSKTHLPDNRNQADQARHGPAPLSPVCEHVACLLAGEREQPPSARHFHQDPAGEASDNDVVADAHCRNRGKAYYGLGGRIRA